jgi:secreted trypsin-like serine protease
MMFVPDAPIPYWYAVGVVSFGGKDCGKKIPGVYTNVANYLNWLSQVMRSLK